MMGKRKEKKDEKCISMKLSTQRFFEQQTKVTKDL